MSNQSKEFSFAFCIYVGMICWYFAVLNVIHPVIHPIFGYQYNSLIFAVFDTTIAYSCFLIALIFNASLDEDWFL